MNVHDPAAKLRPVNIHLPTVDYLRSMWGRRDFAIAMPAEELRASHQNTLLGNIWHLGNPMLTVGCLLRGVRCHPRHRSGRGQLHPVADRRRVFVPAHIVDRGRGGPIDLVESGPDAVYSFSRAILPVSVVLSNIYSFGFQLCVLAFVAFATGEGASSRWLLMPFVLAIHTAFNLGGAFVAARLNDSFRDIQQIIPFLFNLLRYMSGVMFPISRFLEADTSEHAALRPLIEHNPMRLILAMYRWVFLGDPMATTDVVRIMVVSAVMLVAGFSFFRAAEWRYGRN